MGHNQEEICRELAEISIENGLLQLSSWQDASSSGIQTRKEDVKAPEVPESILPRVVSGDFRGYLTKFGDAEVGGRGEHAQGLLTRAETDDWRTLPSFLFEDHFRLNDPTVWEYVFASDDARHWEKRATELENKESLLEDEMLEEIYRKHEELGLLSTRYESIAKTIKALSMEIQRERLGFHEQSCASKSYAGRAAVLKRKQHNLKVVLDICKDLYAFQSMFTDFQRVIETIEGLKFPQDDFVLESFKDLKETIDRLGGTYSAVEGFNRHNFSDTISSMLRDALYGALDSLFEASSCNDMVNMSVVSILDKLIQYTGEEIEELSLVLHQYLRDIVHRRVHIALTESSSDVDIAMDTEYFSKRIQDGKSLTSSYEVLGEIFDNVLKISEQIDAISRDHGSVQWDFVRRVCQCFLHVWVSVLLGLSHSAKLVTIEIHTLEDLLQALETFESKISLAGLHAASTLAGPKQEVCRACIDSTSEKWAAKISEVILTEKWKYMSNIEELESKFVDLVPEPIEIDQENQLLVLGGRKYGIIKSFTDLVDYLLTMRTFSDILPSLSSDIGRKVVEILRQFNSQTCQLVLGAGAMQSAGLRSITVKNLAVSCQQIDMLLYITSNEQNRYVHESSSSNALVLGKEFGRCMDDMKLHCHEIRSKIVQVTCDLMIPLIKDASILLSSAIRNGKYEGVLLPAFADLVDAMVRNFLIVAKVISETLCESDVISMIESIWEEIIVWIRDGAMSFDPEQKEAVKCYVQHLTYIKDKLTDYPVPSCIIQLIDTLNSR